MSKTTFQAKGVECQVQEGLSFGLRWQKLSVATECFRTVIPVKIPLKQTPNWNPTSHRRRTFAEAFSEPMRHTMQSST